MKLILGMCQRVGRIGFWRGLVNFWTIIFFASIVYDFLNHNILDESNIILTIAGIYCAALAIYSAEKEFRRWNKVHDSIHPGELYALLWTILIIGIVIAQPLFHIEYKMPAEVSASYIAVISILAITRESKSFYQKKVARK
ncbi:MAG: hypothetical protein WC763_03825 [Candidatus Paceibacterota bacterium]|jgi:hypothetical protein